MYGQGATGNANPLNNNLVGWYIPGKRTTVTITNNDVNGTCYWKEDWMPARIFLQNGAVYFVNKAKLNFHSNSVEFIDEKGAEGAPVNVQF